MKKYKLKPLVVAVGVIFGASCGGSSGIATETSTSAPLVTSTLATSTTTSTLPTATTVPVSPKESLDALADSLKAIDYSRISQGDCGTFAMVVSPRELWLFEYDWDFREWVDKSFLLGEPLGSKPIRVTTRDYTGDDVNDFLVAYGDNLDVMSSGREYGAIFAYPLFQSGEVKCKWSWVDLVGGIGSFKIMDWLSYDDDAEVIRAQDFHEGGGRTTGILTYSPDDHAFFFSSDEILD